MVFPTSIRYDRLRQRAPTRHLNSDEAEARISMLRTRLFPQRKSFNTGVPIWWKPTSHHHRIHIRTWFCQVWWLTSRFRAGECWAVGNCAEASTPTMLENIIKSLSPTTGFGCPSESSPTITATDDPFDSEFVSPHCSLAKPPHPNPPRWLLKLRKSMGLHLHLHRNGNRNWEYAQATTKFYGCNIVLPAQHTRPWALQTRPAAHHEHEASYACPDAKQVERHHFYRVQSLSVSLHELTFPSKSRHFNLSIQDPTACHLSTFTHSFDILILSSLTMEHPMHRSHSSQVLYVVAVTNIAVAESWLAEKKSLASCGNRAGTGCTRNTP